MILFPAIQTELNSAICMILFDDKKKLLNLTVRLIQVAIQFLV